MNRKVPANAGNSRDTKGEEIMASSHRDYIPHNAAQFNAFVKNIIQYVEKNTGGATPAWQGIPRPRRHAQGQRDTV